MRLPWVLVAASSRVSLAQWVNQDPDHRNLTTVHSPIDDSITISYKEPHGACRTAFEDQQQYTGWVNIPGDYQTNLFFWYVGAREPTKALTIWLNGGPGSSSMLGFFAGNGPCEVVEKGLDTYDTVANQWGWDRASNMLFIDQPNLVGLSYDTPTNGTFNLTSNGFEYPPYSAGDDDFAGAVLNGTFGKSGLEHTPNTTETAAMAVWHMMQGFLSTFEQFQTPTKAPIGVNLFAESYGGRYGPIFADVWEEQNDKLASGDLSPDSALELHLVSLGIVNGCVDRKIQMPQYLTFANNNTYGVKALSEATLGFLERKLHDDGGCLDLLDQCAEAVASEDPGGKGDDEDVNEPCQSAISSCGMIEDAFYRSDISAYDVAAPYANPEPSDMFIEYLNQASVQQAIGSPVNYTLSNNDVGDRFYETGDISRDGNIARLAALLKRGIRVGLIYGDRDYICNWFGGEAVSLEVAKEVGDDYATKFPAAGYAPIMVNDSYVGGEVRQYGNLSFSRVYQAGHSVAWYQPEAAFEIFARIIGGGSVSTGQKVDLSSYNTSGPVNSTKTNELPDPPKPTCFIRSAAFTCDLDSYNQWMSGEGVVINGMFFNSADDWPLAKSSSTAPAGPTPTEDLKGAYTATPTGSNDDGDGDGDNDDDAENASTVNSAHRTVVCGVVAMLVMHFQGLL